MTTNPKVTLVTCKALPNLFPGEEGLLDELASRGCDPQIKVWNDPDVDWADAGMVVVRSVSDYAADRPAFLEWTRQLRRVQNSKDVLNWNTDKHYLKELAAMGLPTIPTNWLEPSQKLTKHQIHTRFPLSVSSSSSLPCLPACVMSAATRLWTSANVRPPCARCRACWARGAPSCFSATLRKSTCTARFRLCSSTVWSPTPLRSARPCTPPPSPIPRCTRPW